MDAMIMLTRINGSRFALNCDLIERVESTHDTVLTLVDGTRYLVTESVDEVVESVRAYRASIVALSHQLESIIEAQPALRLVTDPEAER
jgi:flagellar protein FlbD